MIPHSPLSHLIPLLVSPDDQNLQVFRKHRSGGAKTKVGANAQASDGQGREVDHSPGGGGQRGFLHGKHLDHTHARANLRIRVRILQIPLPW